jgi:hypothetical protein
MCARRSTAAVVMMNACDSCLNCGDSKCLSGSASRKVAIFVGDPISCHYGRPLNFFKTIAAIDFLTYLSLLKPLNMSGFAPDDTPASKTLAARYSAIEGKYASQK